MESTMKCIIDINENDIVSVKVPEQFKNFTIEQFNRAGTWLKETDSIGLNHWKVNIKKGNYRIIGFAKDVFVEDYDKTKHDNFILQKI